jgi:hypothetical protein
MICSVGRSAASCRYLASPQIAVGGRDTLAGDAGHRITVGQLEAGFHGAAQPDPAGPAPASLAASRISPREYACPARQPDPPACASGRENSPAMRSGDQPTITNFEAVEPGESRRPIYITPAIKSVIAKREYAMRQARNYQAFVNLPRVVYFLGKCGICVQWSSCGSAHVAGVSRRQARIVSESTYRWLL